MDLSSFQKFIQRMPRLLNDKGLKAHEDPELLQNILTIEVIFIVSAMVGLFLFHRIRKFKQKKVKRVQKEIRQGLAYFIKENRKPDFTFIFEKSWDRLPLLLPVVESIDRKFQLDVRWLFVMDELFEQILFPLARKDAMSPWWIKRNWALRCLSMVPLKQDEALFLNFLCDPSTHNRFGAIRPLLKVGSAHSLNVIVEVMEDENRHTQAVFLAVTKFGGENFYGAIRERLIRETDPAAKRVCIDILSDALESSDIFLIKRDLFGSDKSLRLTALRCLGKFEIHHSTQLLLGFLEDDLWEVRSLAAKFLGQRKAYQAIPLLIEAACDRNWWVRLNSIQALFELGDSGQLALETITPEKDKYAHEMLQYVRALKEQDKEETSEEERYLKLLNNEKKSA